jgi:hypothetical protein
MTRFTRFLTIAVTTFILGGTSYTQQNFKIDSLGAGGAKVGMTVAKARTAMKGCQFSRGSDGEGIALIDVSCRGSRTMTLYAGEESDVENPIDFRARIEMIEVWDPRFKTAQGIHVGMPVADAERRLGKIKEIILTPIESREFIFFSKPTPNIRYRFYGGIYPPRSSFTTDYQEGAKLWSIQVEIDQVSRQPEA